MVKSIKRILLLKMYIVSPELRITVSFSGYKELGSAAFNIERSAAGTSPTP